MGRLINSDEGANFVEWLYDEHDIEFFKGHEKKEVGYIQAPLARILRRRIDK